MTKSITSLPNLHDSTVMTSRAQYAITALLKLYSYRKENPVSLAMIAEEEDISISYLEQLFAGLRKHGIVKSYRGPGGGYVLGKDPSQITICDIMIAAEDCAPARRSKKAAGRKHQPDTDCPTAILWGKLNKFILEKAGAISLVDVADCDIIELEQACE